MRRILAITAVVGVAAILVFARVRAVPVVSGVNRDAAPAGGPGERAGAALAPRFEPNVGQADEQVRFLSRGQGYTMLMTGNGAVLKLGTPPQREPGPGAKLSRPAEQAVIGLTFKGANPDPVATGNGRLAGVSNYLRGSDPDGWLTGVPNYSRVTYRELYDGVDLDWYANRAGELEFDLTLAPGADPAGIRLSYTGTERLVVDSSGALADEDAVASGRLVRWAVDLAAWVDATTTTAREPEADALLRRELANLRAAWRLARQQDRLDDAVAFLLAVADAAGWRDLTEIWGWARELATDPATEVHHRAAAVLGAAASTAWLAGDPAEAGRLARHGLSAGHRRRQSLVVPDCAGARGSQRRRLRRRGDSRHPGGGVGVPAGPELRDRCSRRPRTAATSEAATHAEPAARRDGGLPDPGLPPLCRRRDRERRRPAGPGRGALRAGHRAGPLQRRHLRRGHRLGRAGDRPCRRRPHRPGAARATAT